MIERIHIALQDFQTDAAAGARSLRQLREENEGEFATAGLSALLEPNPGPGYKDLIQMLQETGGDLLPRLLSTVDLEGAVHGMIALCRAEGTTDIRLVKMMMEPDFSSQVAMMTRALDILDRIPTGPRLVPLLMQLYRGAPNQIRARVATTIGRHHRNEDWVGQRPADPDPRVRANIVELYIGDTSHLALEVFRKGLADPATRVMANAALGLYFAGSAHTLKFLGADLTSSSCATERAAGAWAMGQARDPRFRWPLSRLVRDADPMVRRQAIRGLATLRRSSEQQEQRQDESDEENSMASPAPLEVTIKATLQHRGPAGDAHYRLEIRRQTDEQDYDEYCTTAGKLMRDVRPIEIHTWENNEPVLDYELRDREAYGVPGSYDLLYQSRFPQREPEVKFEFRKHSSTYRTD